MKYGTTEYKNKEYTLTEEAYPDSSTRYKCDCEDVEGNIYTAYFDIIDNECSDFSMSCNWDNASEIIAK